MTELTPEMLTLASIVSVKIQSCVTRFEDEERKKKKYTSFVIELKTHGGLIWNVERRFSQFHQLNETLKKRYAELKMFKFPPKRWFSSFATQTVEQRRRVFEIYLQELLCLQPRPVELNNFLDINSHIWGQVVNQSGLNGLGGDILGDYGGHQSPFMGSNGISNSVSSEFLSRLKAGNVGLDDFELLKVLGKGSFGKVFLVRLIATGNIYAMKVLKKSEVVRRRQVEHTLTERRIMGGIDHPFVVALRFAFQTSDKLYMITDYCRGGELFFHLKKYKTFPEKTVKFFAAELVAALSHLHSLQIVYRDLKPENVLLDHEGHIHITDFGLSKDDVVDDKSAMTFCGTPEYLAPEMLINRKSREGYGKAVDWWSLGTLIFEMLTGWPPFYDKNLRKMCEQILKSDIHFPGTSASSTNIPMSSEAKDLIRGLLTRDPTKRLGSRPPMTYRKESTGEVVTTPGGVGDIKAHPFFKDIDWDALLALRIEPPFKPRVESETDITNFDSTFTDEPAVLTPPAPSELAAAASGSQNDQFAEFSFINVLQVASDLPAHMADDFLANNSFSPISPQMNGFSDGNAVAVSGNGINDLQSYNVPSLNNLSSGVADNHSHFGSSNYSFNSNNAGSMPLPMFVQSPTSLSSFSSGTSVPYSEASGKRNDDMSLSSNQILRPPELRDSLSVISAEKSDNTNDFAAGSEPDGKNDGGVHDLREHLAGIVVNSS